MLRREGPSLRILILTQCCTPEIGATRTRVHTRAAGLAHAGHEVVVCGVPNHPQAVVHPASAGARWCAAGATASASHLWVATSREKTTLKRLAYDADMATVLGAALRRPDVILGSSPPLPVAAAGAAIASPLFDVGDLWPAAAVALAHDPEQQRRRKQPDTMPSVRSIDSVVIEPLISVPAPTASKAVAT